MGGLGSNCMGGVYALGLFGPFARGLGWKNGVGSDGLGWHGMAWRLMVGGNTDTLVVWLHLRAFFRVYVCRGGKRVVDEDV
jgi:hypothetical protein